MDGVARFYRAHTPEWASAPLSGAGAAKQGGRLNRQGVHALYLADSAETAIAEYKQAESLMPPCTLVEYRVVIDRVVDFSGGFSHANWSPLWQDLSCNWRRIALLERAEPPSWVLADEVRAQGFRGVLFPSSHVRGTNLVVYTDALTAEDHLSVHDPAGQLPRDRSSWGGQG